MTPAEDRLAQDRALRRAARGLFDRRIGQVKADLSARGVGGRIADSVTDKVIDVVDNGMAVARASKGIIAATAGALALWWFRKPIIAKWRELNPQSDVQGDADNTPPGPDQEH